MEPKTMTWSVSDQLQETYASSSLGFRNQNKCVTTNCKKGGLALWQN